MPAIGKVMDHMLHPGKVGIARWRRTVLPSRVVGELISTPLFCVKRWIGKNKIEDWTAILPDNTWNGR